MAYMRFRGEVGQEVYGRVANCRDWLASSLVVDGLKGEKRRRAEEELIAFLLNTRFGEEAILEEGFESQLDYIRQTHAWNPHCFKLLKSREPLAVDAETSDGVVQMVLGYAQGVSMVVPMTDAGYEAYKDRKIWSLKIRQEHVMPPGDVLANSRHVYIGTLFDFVAMPRLLGNKGHLVQHVGTSHDSLALLQQLFRHAARFFPRILYDQGSCRYFAEGDDPDRLPTFICATDSSFGEGLVTTAGFVFHDINMVGCPVFVLRMADVNDESVDTERRERISTLIQVYWRFLKRKRR